MSSIVPELLKTFTEEKNLLQKFVSSPVPPEILDKLKVLFKMVLKWEEETLQKGNLTHKIKQDLVNVAELKGQLPKIKQLRYKQLIQVLFRFPSKFQMGLDKDTLRLMQMDPDFEKLRKHLLVDKYIEKSLRFFLTDCVAFLKLREEQIAFLQKKNLEKALDLEKHFAIIPNHFLLLERLSSKEGVCTFRGVNLATNQPIFIKYISKSKSRTDAAQKLVEHNFAREVKAFERLLEHRDRQIEKGDEEVDKYFVKVYRVAKGNLRYFRVEKNHFSKKNQFFREEEEEVEFMIMRYVEGANLKELMKDYRSKNIVMTEKLAIQILQKILEALNYCHNNGIVHRDICPSNILITKSFQVRLNSLGLETTEELKEAAHRRFIGNAFYTAPEGILLKREDSLEELINATDARFDIYSVGCIAYEMLTGTPPFISAEKGRKQELEVLQRHIQDIPEAIPEKNSQISDTLNSWVIKMLAKDRNQRFHSAADALKALKYYISVSHKSLPRETRETPDDLQQTQEFKIEDIAVAHTGSFAKWKIIAVVIVVVLIGYMFFTENGTALRKRLMLQYQQTQRAEEIQGKIAAHRQELQKLWDQCRDILSELEQQYPAENGYPTASSRVQSIHQRIAKHLDKLQKIIDGASVNTIEWIGTYQNYVAEDQYSLTATQRILEKLQKTLSTAEQLKKARDQERKARETYYAIKDFLFRTKEVTYLIDEKLAILKTHYTAQQNYIQIDKKTLENLEQIKQVTQNFAEIIDNVDEFQKQGNFAAAHQKLTPHWNFQQPQTDLLVDIEESVNETLAACEQLEKERKKAQLINQTMASLQGLQQQLQEQLKATKIQWQKAKDIANHGLQPEEAFATAQNKIKTIQQNLLQVNEHLQQGREQQALELVSANSLDNKVILSKLQALESQMQDIIKIASAPKVPEVDEKEVLQLLTEKRKSLLVLQRESTLLQNQAEELQKQFAKYFSNNTQKKYRALLGNITQQQTTQQNLIAAVEQHIQEQNLSQALKMLKQHQGNDFSQLYKNAAQMQKHFVAIQKKAEKQQQQQLYLAQIAKAKERLQGFCNNLQQRLQVTENRLQNYRIKYPEDLGYTQVAPEHLSALQQGKNLQQQYQQILDKVTALEQRQKIIEAYEIVQPLYRQRLSDPSLMRGLQGLDNHLNEIEQIAAVEAISKRKWQKAREVIVQLEENKNTIDELITSLQTKVETLKEYPNTTGYLRVDPQVAKYLGDARQEAKELGLMIQDGRKWLASKEFYKISEHIEPYASSRFSFIPLLKTYIVNTEKAIATNENYQRNPQLLSQKQKEQQQHKSEKQRLASWRKPPALWYNDVKRTLERYGQKSKQVSNSLEDKSATFVHARLELEIKKIEEFPDWMAELRELVESIKRQGKKFPKEEAFDTDKERAFHKYMRSELIEIAVTQEISQIEEAIQLIDEDLKLGGGVEESTMRLMLRNIQSISRKFEEAYVPVKSVLLNLEYAN